MAIFDQKTAAKKDSAPFSASDLPPFRDPPPAHADAGTGPAPGTAPRQQPAPAKESLIAGDDHALGAQLVELQQGGILVGDVKAGSMTVASGARMRGQADFGWEDKDGKRGNVESFSAP